MAVSETVFRYESKLYAVLHIAWHLLAARMLYIALELK
jgi:hypothetical protein